MTRTDMFLAATEAPQKRELNGDGGHWYTPDGTPCHTVEKKDGSGPRNTNKLDAKKLGLFPSVTSITKIVANPSLDRWKQNQMLNACVSSPIKKGDSLERYEANMRELAAKKMVDARAFGSLFHSAIDELNVTGYLTDKFEEVKPFVKHYLEWTRDNRVSFVATEFVCVNKKLGYAGQVDGLAVVNGKLTLLDYKTQDVKKDAKGKLKPNFYESWVWQLAAYAKADWPNKPKRIQQVMSVVLCSQEPCYPIIKVWSREELARAWKVFKASCQIWQADRKFDPAANAAALANGQVATK
ncbi:PD-(D/E)XK nuclease family protein [uncultured Limnobacter sp.]|uniref:PD-(D/E)XK nuclease family protein n=1 Tax=uncultured Limnobacter sp. TaxID=199681 RepID=UPI0032B28677